MTLSEKTIGRLYNWKFDSALRFAKEQSPLPTSEEILAIKALADTFGNCGYFDGTLALVVRGAVHDLIGDQD